MTSVKTWITRAAMTPFMAVGGVGIGEIFGAAHPAIMPFTITVSLMGCLVLCWAMYWRVED